MGAVVYYWPTSESGTLQVAEHVRTGWDARGKRVRASQPTRYIKFSDYRFKTSDAGVQRAIEATRAFTTGRVRRLSGSAPVPDVAVVPATLGLVTDVLARLPALPDMDDDEFDPFGD